MAIYKIMIMGQSTLETIHDKLSRSGKGILLMI